MRSRALAVARTEVRALRPYHRAPDEGRPLRARLDFNEAPVDVPAELKEAVLASLGRRRWGRYPEFGSPRLTAAIAARHGVSPANIVVGHGSGEVLLAAVSVFAGGGGTLLIAPPTFSLYDQMAVLSAARVEAFPRAPSDFSLDIAGFAARAAEGERTVPLLCAPNNPTGNPLRVAEVETIAVAARVLFLDQAYVDFSPVEDDAIPLISKMPHLVVFRTLSKAFSAAGFRIGYAVAHEDVAREIRKAVLPFSVDLAAEELAVALLERPEIATEVTAAVALERERVRKRLVTLGVSVAPSEANFLFFRVTGRTGAQVHAGLRRLGILVREPGAADHVRVTVGAPGENDLFLAALEEVR